MDPPLYARRLRWADVSPGEHAFAPAELDAVVDPIVGRAAEHSAERARRRPLDPNLTPPASVGDERGLLALHLDRALTARFGAWINGWMWAASEPGCGGPVKEWCCPRDSLRLRDAEAVTASIAQVKRAVLDWRAVLEDLDRRFTRLEIEGLDLDVPRAAEHAAVELATWAVERTGATDAWYATFATVLRWYLERRGDDDEAIGPAILEVASGVFRSWVAPDEAMLAKAASEVRDALIAQQATLRAEPDVLAQWITAREKAFTRASPLPSRRAPVVRDGHLAYVDTHDAARDVARATQMSEAIAAARTSAMSGEPLTLERLAAWTSLSLGRPATLRTTDAYAKRGRERYGMRSKLDTEVEAALAQASGRDAVLVRAARVYLDVCAFHPFDDGNARAARLALDHVLTASGLALHVAEPVFLLARPSAAPHGGRWLVYLLAHVVGDRAER